MSILVGTGLSSHIGQALLPMLPADIGVLSLGRTPVTAPGVTWLSADLRQSAEAWGPAVRAWLQQRGEPVVGFVHAAGIVYSDAADRTTHDEWQSTMQVNVGSAFQLGQILRPYLTSGSAVVVVGSVDAWYASQDGPAAAYGASKSALAGLVRHWAAEWGSGGIRVNGVAPGALAVGSGPADEETWQHILPHIAMGRMGRPEEVAHLIAFLLSERSSYMTGAWIPVDGGLNIRY